VTTRQAVFFFNQTKLSKLDLVRYCLSVAPGALAGIGIVCGFSRDSTGHTARRFEFVFV
jgi:hypothetical protein